MSAISRQLVRVGGGEDELDHRHPVGCNEAQRGRGGSARTADCNGEQLGDPAFGERQQLVELLAAKRHPLGRALDLDEAAGRGHDHVHVHLGPGILLVGQVEHAHAVDHAHGDRGDRVTDRVLAKPVRLEHAGKGVVQRDVGPADRRRAGPTVRLEDVAVHGDLDLAQRYQVTDGA